MPYLHLNPALLALWLSLALGISAVSTAVISHNLVLDVFAISVTVLTVAGTLLSMVLLFVEHIMEICSS
jgi:hypothetical protein